MRALIGGETSGIIRDALIAVGVDAISCDFLETEKPGPHYQGNYFDILWEDWDLFIVHPDCTYLTASGLHWNSRPEGIAVDRASKTKAAIANVQRTMDESEHIKYFALENPAGAIGTNIRKADFYTQPYNFGADASKRTGWWTRNLPQLERTEYVHPRWVCKECKYVLEDFRYFDMVSNCRAAGRCKHGNCDGVTLPRWGNQTDSGQNKLGPSEDRWLKRARTYPGIADALADQWGRLILGDMT